ncbi:DNA-binding transcriptional regulator, XRE-family HTH domain [Streptomyces sp. KS_16]|nr:DNA-binding XRE family transcriptional regulator [Streptomyces sp. 2321.6]SDR45972.1 DNA-binding transcriptional regulator, XRE-family HTH domain [Streptomyces sp. KS_16]SEC78761.1 DNA-binding transcriptional regulator, XRE-family HTH domain [Streptomyces sp. 2133.1]SNC69044.1 DNA-binding transcriptional regulator, XRE-family HTH domain [Streptomyces sp. 2114.4]
MGRSIGANIRRLREERGWSQARLAREVCQAARVTGDPVGRQEVSRWETGKRTPREWLPFLAAALGVPLEALREPQKLTEPPLPTLADFLPEEDPLSQLEGRTGRRIGMGQMDDLQKRVHGLRLADDVLAGGDLIRPALRDLRRAVNLYRQNTYTSEVERQLLRQIGELAQIAGWIASDAGQHEEAEQVYRLGISAATQAEDNTLAGNLAGSLAYQMSNTGREAEGLILAQAAFNDARAEAPPKARALYLDRVAWAHTKAGGTENGQQAMRALGEAGQALSEDSEGAESPAWLYWVDAGELKVMESRVYTELHRPLRAVPLLREVLSGYDATHTREMALYLSWLAVALTDANEPEEAAGVAERVISLGSDTPSDRVAERVRVIRGRLQEYAEVPEVAALLAEHPAV